MDVGPPPSFDEQTLCDWILDALKSELPIVSGSYALHLATRGLPRLAEGEQAKAILQRIQKMSEEWGTVIEVDEDAAGGVVGWVSTVREAELLHPFLRPRTKKELAQRDKADVSPHLDTRAAASQPVGVLVSE